MGNLPNDGIPKQREVSASVSPPSRASPPGRADRPVQSIGAIERSPVPVALADKALPITPAVSARRRGAV